MTSQIDELRLVQNIPTPVEGGRLVAINVGGGKAQLMIESSTPPARRIDVTAGDEIVLPVGRARVAEITGGGHDGPPGRADGMVVLAVLEA